MKYITLMIVVCASTLIKAQDLSIQIYYQEADSLIPLPGVTARWLESKEHGISNAKGVLLIKNSSIATDTLLVEYSGFEPKKFSQGNVPEKITLGALTIEGVVISADEGGAHLDLMETRHAEVLNENELRKAACCNLSEAFETNASVDVSLTDAVSGTKKIQMLGLDGIYTQIQFENIPILRGLSNVGGLSTVPGTWIKSIQISKGSGSVVNGYESIAGSINMDYVKPEDGPRLFVNGYANVFGRAELNAQSSLKVSEKWSTAILTHINGVFGKIDRNNDNFLDLPTGNQVNIFNRWKYRGPNFNTQFGVQGVYTNGKGGTVNPLPESNWVSTNEMTHISGFWKAGWFLNHNQYASVAIISNAKYHTLKNSYGARNYQGEEIRSWTNVMYADQLGSLKHTFRTGLNLLYNSFNETLVETEMTREEIVPGAFLEYTYRPGDKFSLIGGFRADIHNLYGFQYAPRLHVKWNMIETMALRVSGGRGYRTPNMVADNLSLLASNLTFNLEADTQLEVAWNTGISYAYYFTLGSMDASFSTDYYYTYFENQLVVDRDNDMQEVQFYNLTGESFSHSFQAEVSIEPYRQLEFRLAYKFYDVKQTTSGGLLQKTMVPKHRMLFNGSYKTRNKQWEFDLTANLVGPKRLPHTDSNPPEYQRSATSPIYALLNAQVTKTFKGGWDVYVGGENLTNYTQEDPIIASNDTSSPYFDATNVWAPIAGINIYAGFRYTLK